MKKCFLAEVYLGDSPSINITEGQSWVDFSGKITYFKKKEIVYQVSGPHKKITSTKEEAEDWIKEIINKETDRLNRNISLLKSIEITIP
jgi:uncharacterized protein YabE (DUF348 family)